MLERGGPETLWLLALTGRRELQQLLIGERTGTPALRQVAYLLNHRVHLPGHGLSTPSMKSVPHPLYSALES